MRIIVTMFFVSVLLQFASSQTKISSHEAASILLSDVEALEDSDVAGLTIDHSYTNEKTGLTYTYLQQTINDIPIHNALATLVSNDQNEIVYMSHRFLSATKNKLQKNNKLALIPETAVRAAFRAGDVDPSISLKVDVNRSNANHFYFQSEALTDDGADARPVYTLKNDQLILSWDISYFGVRGSDYWNIRVDAVTGDILEKSSYTAHCQFASSSLHHEHRGADDCSEHFKSHNKTAVADGSQYNVFALPTESPLHGSRQLLVDPADAAASPYGWHDENNNPGAENTNTEGNNVQARLDRSGDGIKDRDVEGGVDLIFDFPYDGLDEPIDYQDASTTNLFYMNNMMHDFTHAYGFDEAAGNFQLNNYGNGGVGNDAVIALAQFDGTSPGTNINNADFSTPSEGNNGTMRMFLWNTRNDISVFAVTAPADVAGNYESRTAAFGAVIGSTPLIGQVALVDDGMGVLTDACQGIDNTSDITGKIAMIDRGDCEFGFKILDAENNGAIGAIICNHQIGLLSGQMGAGAVGGSVTIPSVFISREDCARIRVFAGSDLEVKFEAPPSNGQPDRVDGSLDNGIIAHEYGHGISNRLTAGPFNTGCLRINPLSLTRNDGEQMGEGWSDFFGLVLTVEPGDVGSDPRGIGNYAQRNPVNGPGIRAFPYSTDLGVNPVTYDDILEASIPHGVGHIWCSMIWDMYWQFVDRFGWDPDFIHGDKGNNMAIQLVMDGMKMQPCNPGFVDGRDAILAADAILNNSQNHDIIWEAFARRGLGQFADQGSSGRVGDGKEDYTVPPELVKSVKLTKTMSPVIFKGDNISVDLVVRNDFDTDITNVEIIDLIPSGTDVDLSTLPAGTSVSGDQITFVIPTLAAGAQTQLSYQLETPAIPSRLLVFDDFESPESNGTNWLSFPFAGNVSFQYVNNAGFNGGHAWKITNPGSDHEQTFFNLFETTLNAAKPVARFTHWYDTDAGNDGGIFEISTDYFTTFSDLGPHVFREGYSNLQEATFPERSESAFTGLSADVGNWVNSYTDLSSFRGEEAYFRFRFASDEVRSSSAWTVDNFTLFDALTYNSEACLNFDQASTPICAEASKWGTIVEPEEFTATGDIEGLKNQINIYPNPAADYFIIEMEEVTGEAQIEVFDAQGRPVWFRAYDHIQSENQIQIATSQWSAGVYFIEIVNKNQKFTKKIVKR